MIRIRRYNDLFEAVAVHKDVKPEKLPHVADMESKGYRIAKLGTETYAFHKNYEADDDVYWLGKNTQDYKFGQKYTATPEMASNKKNYPFYTIYCKCDPSPTEEQKKIIAEREKEYQKRLEEHKKKIMGQIKEKERKNKNKKR